MILALDVGNSQIFGGLISLDKKIQFTFRKSSYAGSSSDEYGLFLKSVLRENGYDPREIRQIAICSVVPDVMHSLRGACQKYFEITPFILQAGVKTGLRIRYKNPLEVGADRIANSIATSILFPGKNAVIVDLGTATTFCALTSEKDYLGGAIIPGLRISMEALEGKTAKLPTVEILRPSHTVGKGTTESIQSGLFYGHLGAIREMIGRFQAEVFHGERPLVIGTGGFSKLFESEKIFDVEISHLVLIGLLHALELNTPFLQPTTSGGPYATHTHEV
jgi:type III pantothenate kinase